MNSSKRTPPVEPSPASCTASVLRRKYGSDLRQGVADELSARIEHAGQWAFFPLSENQRDVAEKKAETIRSAVARSGWKAAGRFVREFTVAIFWLPNPLTCTYATMFTALRPPPKSRRILPARVRVALLEPDEQIRRGLVHWINACPGYQCVAACDSTSSFFKSVAQIGPDLALFNDAPCTPKDERATLRACIITSPVGRRA